MHVDDLIQAIENRAEGALDLIHEHPELVRAESERTDVGGRLRGATLLHWAAHRIWTKDNAQAEQILLQVLPHFPNNPDILYDLACSRSLAGDRSHGRS